MEHLFSKNETVILLTVKEAAELLRVAIQTIYQWKHQGKIPFVKLNGKLLFERNQILTYVLQEK